jgi:hypothetical protein
MVEEDVEELDHDSDVDSFDWNAFSHPTDGFHSYGEQGQDLSSKLKRGNSTNDSGYSTMAADTGSCSDESEDPWWWEEAAGYSATSYEVPNKGFISEEGSQYLHEERQESAYLSNLLRSQPFDEWTEWRMNLTKLLVIPEEDESQQRPVTPVNTIQQQETPRSPGRRRSLFNFAKFTTRIVLNKRKSLLW